MASRIAARSPSSGTPEESGISTRVKRNAISRSARRVASQPATAAMSAPSERPSACWRSTFSSNTLSEKGRRDTPAKPSASAAARL